jgi:FAD binding domain
MSASTTQSEDLSQIPLRSLYNLLECITIPPGSAKSSFTNWGQTFTCKPLAVFEPENEYQCALIFELARREQKSVRAVGVGHSPSDLACTSGYMLRTTKLDKILEVRVHYTCRYLRSVFSHVLAGGIPFDYHYVRHFQNAHTQLELGQYGEKLCHCARRYHTPCITRCPRRPWACYEHRGIHF